MTPPVAERIFRLGDGRGFAGQRTDYAHRGITVYWSGVVPADVRSYIASRPYGIDITLVTGARYSRAKATAARSRLLRHPIAREVGIVSASVSHDGSGLVLGVTRMALSAGLVSSVKSIAGIDGVKVRYGARESKGYASRNNDASPWKGGARLRMAQGLCSSGFAVLKNGYGRLLSARHCDPSGDGVIRDGGGTTIAPGGSSVAVNANIDSLLMDPSASPATIARIYRGGWSSSSYSTVRNWYSNWVGDPVCTSGASTGEHCGTVYDDNDTHLVHGVQVGVIQVRAPSGSIMGGQGDSGGAMFKKLSNGVQARGILLGPDPDYAETTSCGTVAPDTGGFIYCSRYIDYVPISTILNTWGLRLEVA
ncbi:MAG: hypothetical protein ACRDT4_16420 [Micromonosporaceae bacterium]